MLRDEGPQAKLHPSCSRMGPEGLSISGDGGAAGSACARSPPPPRTRTLVCSASLFSSCGACRVVSGNEIYQAVLEAMKNRKLEPSFQERDENVVTCPASALFSRQRALFLPWDLGLTGPPTSPPSRCLLGMDALLPHHQPGLPGGDFTLAEDSETSVHMFQHPVRWLQIMGAP